MTDITPVVNQLLKSHGVPGIRSDTGRISTAQAADEFLNEAYRINAHIASLFSYLKSIRQSYLSTTPASSALRRHYQRNRSSAPDLTSLRSSPSQLQKLLTDEERDSVDSSTALLLRDLSSSIANLASAETLRQETQSTLLRRKHGYPSNSLIWKWAGGGIDESPPRSLEQERDEESAKTIKAVRESVLWSLRRDLEGAAEVQREMVEKRIEREKEKQKSVLHKMGSGRPVLPSPSSSVQDPREGIGKVPPTRPHDATMSEDAVAEIEAQLSPEQLQLFAQENDSLLKHYEDTLSKVQNAEKSLLEISSLQQTLVTHLSTQEDYINQLVTDASTTQANVGKGNKELKRAAERRSMAQTVFWASVGLCTWLIVWDAIF